MKKWFKFKMISKNLDPSFMGWVWVSDQKKFNGCGSRKNIVWTRKNQTQRYTDENSKLCEFEHYFFVTLELLQR